MIHLLTLVAIAEVYMAVSFLVSEAVIGIHHCHIHRIISSYNHMRCKISNFNVEFR